MPKHKKREVNPRTLALFRMGGMKATCAELYTEFPALTRDLLTAIGSINNAIEKLKREVPN